MLPVKLLPPTVYNGFYKYPAAHVVEIKDYIGWMKIFSSWAFSVQFHMEVRMDITAILLAAFGLDSFKQNSDPPGHPCDRIDCISER